MGAKLFVLAVVALSLIQSGCATGFQATGPRGNGLMAGASFGQPAAPVVIQESGCAPAAQSQPPVVYR